MWRHHQCLPARRQITGQLWTETSSTSYDLDGLVVASTDKQGATTEVDHDARGLVTEVRVPHDDSSGPIEYRTTRYEYDEAGNRTKVVTPRGVETTGEADDFVQELVYDELNRVVEQVYPYDPGDPEFSTPEKIVYSYDVVGNMTSVSAPPSAGQTERNETSYEYFDNGWVASSTDVWDISTTYDYNALGQQIQRTLTSAGGSSRAMSWSYYPDGKLAGRGDDGVPVGEHVVLVDNTDTGNITTEGSWPDATAGDGFYGRDYRTHVADDGTTTDDAFTWRTHIPQSGDYEVFVRYPAGLAGAAADAPYTVSHDGGEAVVPVDQTVGGGQWQSLARSGSPQQVITRSRWV
jgi:YD repeat-containing protein